MTLHGAAPYGRVEPGSDLSEEEYLALVLGPRRQDDQVINDNNKHCIALSLTELLQALLWLITIFYVIVFISGLLGNISVIVVIIKSKGLHCAMNFYLLSLALADILIILLGAVTSEKLFLQNKKLIDKEMIVTKHY